jgi:serine/threonine protein kinase
LIIAVEYLHEQDIIHGNLSPGNVLFDAKGFAHINDFKYAVRMTGDVSFNSRSYS